MCRTASRAYLRPPRWPEKVGVFNLGTDAYVTVDQSASYIAKALGLAPEFSHSGGERGWVGDNPFIYLDVSRIRSLGWEPELTIEQAVTRTVRWLQENEWVFERRS